MFFSLDVHPVSFDFIFIYERFIRFLRDAETERIEGDGHYGGVGLRIEAAVSERRV